MDVRLDSPKLVVRPNARGRHFEIQGEESSLLTLANRFLAAVAARGLAVMTLRAYAFDLVVLLRWLTATGRAIDKLRQADLLAFITDERVRGVQASSINRRLTTLEALYFFVSGEPVPRGKDVSVAMPNRRGRGYDRTGAHRVGPATRCAVRAKTSKKLIEPLCTVQVKTLIKTLDRYRDLALVYLMLFCGLRSHEVLGLKIDDIDADNQSLLVNGKGGKQRVVPLPSIVCSTIAGYLRCERPRHCLTDRLFVLLYGYRRGCLMTRAGLRSLFRKRRRKQTRLNNANPHRLRHTYGADMARAGIGMPALQQLMGHGDVDTTLRYINLSLKDVTEEFLKVSARIRERYDT